MSSSSSDSGSPPSSPDRDIPEVQTTPAPASQVQLINIKTHVPMVLDFKDANYGPWRLCFLAVFAKFGLLDHVNGAAAQGTSDWVQNDYSIISWLYCTISTDLLRTVQTRRDTAYSLWRSIRGLFRNNAATRSVYLSAEFRNVYQGDMSVMAYCTKVKQLADQLGDLGAPVSEPDLITTLLCGLNPRLQHAISSLTVNKLPSFLKVRSHLLLEEHRADKTQQLAQRSALLAQQHSTDGAPATPPAPATGLVAQPNATTGAGSSTSRGGKKSKNKKKGSGGGSFSNTSHSGSPQIPASWNNPWAGMCQTWPVAARPPLPPPSTGVLGPRPNVPPAQAYFNAPTPSVPAAPSSSTPSWDQAALINALNAMSMQSSSAGPSNWVMDTGASNHMANHGNLLSLSPAPYSARILVGNGSFLPVSHSGYSTIPTASRALHLQNILVAPKLVQNLLSVRTLTRDNSVSVEFDPRGFSIKDLCTKTELLRCDSAGDLYPLTASAATALVAHSTARWHKRLGHPSNNSLSQVLSSFDFQFLSAISLLGRGSDDSSLSAESPSL
ncbi:hypothetical protein U9M48_014593 [Paspalum notatum var. saurae]|uniref:Retrovirus-related Pol polyprotein from transposon TNT 1-94-like beta-barrel domain-containing protein n=1 Tax=Paspalum notatum var. saurae TaxID=547442 RepID=A0AAQ3T4N8_PASNO